MRAGILFLFLIDERAIGSVADLERAADAFLALVRSKGAFK